MAATGSTPEGAMPTLVLRRFVYRDDCVAGALLHQNWIVCYTLEEPWKNNEPRISCIPPGVYRVARHDSDRHPHTWRVEGVPGRSGILFHPGNTTWDTEGCILVGRHHGLLEGVCAVLDSQAAMADLSYLTKDWTGFWLAVEFGKGPN